MRRTMKLILQFAMIFGMILRVYGGSVRGIVGDPVQFPVKCPMDGTAELYREDGTENPPRVAARRDGVCTPGDGFRDRLDLNSCFSFSRSLYTDTGLYEIRCGGGSDHIQLDVVVAAESSVSEGEPVTLKCYYKTAGRQVEAVRWEKDGVMVLEVNLSTGEITNGTGFEGKRLSPAGATEGDFSLTLDQAQVQDEGDYFCSVRSKGVRMGWGDPAAARLKVIVKLLDPTTPRPPLDGTTGERMETWTTVIITTAAVTSLPWALLCLFLVWWLKFRTPNVSPVSDGGRQLKEYEMVHLTNGNSAGPQTNGGPQV